MVGSRGKYTIGNTTLNAISSVVAYLNLFSITASSLTFHRPECASLSGKFPMKLNRNWEFFTWNIVRKLETKLEGR